MHIHEYQAKELLAEFSLPVAKGYFAASALEAEFAFRRLKGSLAVIKAQVHAGGRGQGGGVKLVRSAEEAFSVAEAMLGSTLVTKQTGEKGKVVHGVYVEAGCDISHEYYLSLLVDRASAKVALLFSRAGGMDIEDVAEKHPEKLIKLYLDYDLGFRSYHAWQLRNMAGLDASQMSALTKVIHGLFEMFKAYDCQVIEINPLCVLKDGSFLVLDAKCDFDDNALAKHPKILSYRDLKEEEASELEASKYGLSYVGLDGSIGCLVNGAGLAMATMDIIKLHGGEPLNFLDVGGGASAEQVKQAFRLILREDPLKAIFVNIFGGIMHCDVIARGIVDAAKECGGIRVPLVIRLEGTRVEEGRKILAQSDLDIALAKSMSEGAQKAVALACS